MIPGDLVKMSRICDGGYSIPIIGLFLKSRVADGLGILEYWFLVDGEIEIVYPSYVKNLISLV